MEKVVCEICKGNDILKKNNVYVCQCCGVKYSLDEVKSIVFNENNSSKQLDDRNYLKALELHKYQDDVEAELFCNKFLNKNKNNSYGLILKALILNSKNLEKYNIYTLNVILNLLDNAIIHSNEDNHQDILNKVISAIVKTFEYFGDFLQYKISFRNHNESLTNLKEFINSLYNNASLILIKCNDEENISFDLIERNSITNIESIFKSFYEIYEKERYPDEDDWKCFMKMSYRFIEIFDDIINNKTKNNSIKLILLKNILKLTSLMLNYGAYLKFYGEGFQIAYCNSDEEKNKIMNIIQNTIIQIQKYDPNFKVKDVPQIIKQNTRKGCYVATSIYGSYDCPNVWTLRRYRDYTLAKTWYGRLFIKTYYFISPTIVKYFGETKLFKNIFKKKLDKMSSKLNEKGYDNTPYDDLDWR